MATTTNYGWTTPDDTALVKDGASAIRSLGTSVDTTTKIRGICKNISDIVGLSSIANKAEPSLFEYTLEDGSGTLYLEDGTGNYVQEAPVKVFNETVGIVETKNRLGVLFRWISETVGLSEASEAYNVIKKVVSSTLGL